jgi:hypothetical protein
MTFEACGRKGARCGYRECMTGAARSSNPSWHRDPCSVTHALLTNPCQTKTHIIAGNLARAKKNVPSEGDQEESVLTRWRDLLVDLLGGAGRPHGTLRND